MASGVPFFAGYELPINGTVALKSTTTTSDWIPVENGVAFNFWYAQNSAGSVSATITIDYTIFELDNKTLKGPTVTGVTNYRTITLKSGETNKAAWQHYDTPAEMSDYPFTAYRVNVALSGAADSTGIWFAVCHNGV